MLFISGGTRIKSVPQNFWGPIHLFLEQKFRLHRVRKAAAQKRGGFLGKHTGITTLFRLPLHPNLVKFSLGKFEL